ncbi:hypothetical protein [Endozoicomonas sp. 4G]|uniref:hypothetical protein n=1 Tax=Endozoicomonas sp. 4G TaxID=2872754 RepID=UPI0020788935|nr:hypothetical protein [Endozoicomonas sp. 4G]
MKTSGKRILLFSCLLFICSAAHSGLSTEERFQLLSHYNNTSLVEDGLKLVTSGSGLAASTAINYGLWYGICKATGVVPALTGRFALSGTEQNELQEIKSSFCNELAAVLTTTEIALAGRVSPWPLETPWWQPLRFAGAAYSGYVAYNAESNPYLIPIIAAGSLTQAVLVKTGAAGITLWNFSHLDKSTIEPLDYPRLEYSMLSFFAGMITGTIFYEQMRAKGASKAKAGFAYLISFALVERILAISALSLHKPGSSDLIGAEAGAETLAAMGALAGSWAATASGTLAVTRSSSTIMGGVALAGTLWSACYHMNYHIGRPFKSIGLTLGVFVGTQAMINRGRQPSTLDSNSNNVLRNAALNLVPALTIALLNGLSNNAVYGYSLEESFSKTAWTQWQKFYAPLDYLRTLFN